MQHDRLGLDQVSIIRNREVSLIRRSSITARLTQMCTKIVLHTKLNQSDFHTCMLHACIQLKRATHLYQQCAVSVSDMYTFMSEITLPNECVTSVYVYLCLYRSCTHVWTDLLQKCKSGCVSTCFYGWPFGTVDECPYNGGVLNSEISYREVPLYVIILMVILSTM